MNEFQKICKEYGSSTEGALRLQNYIWRTTRNYTIIVDLLAQLKLKDEEITRLRSALDDARF